MSKSSATKRPAPASGATFTEADLLTELAAAIAADARQPGDVSIAELVAATGRSESTVRRQMERRVARGELVAVMAFDARVQRHVRVWRRAA